MELGIVYDGVTIRFMDDYEREFYARRALPAALIVIVPPSASDDQRSLCDIIPRGGGDHEDENPRGEDRHFE